MSETITVDAWVLYTLLLVAFSMTLLNVVAGIVSWRRGKRSVRSVVTIKTSDPDAFYRAWLREARRGDYRHPEGP